MAKSQSALLAGKFVLLEMVSAYQMIVQAESEEKKKKMLRSAIQGKLQVAPRATLPALI